MSEFPKIDGIEWIDKTIPEIISVRVILVNRRDQDLGLKKVQESEGLVYVDLSRLAGVRPWFPEGEDDASEIECSVDVEGVSNFIASVTLKNMIEAWVFYKRYKYGKNE